MQRTSHSPVEAQASQEGLFEFATAAITRASEAEELLPAPPGSTGNLRKPIEAIVLQPKAGKLTLLDRRFFNVLLRHAQHNPAPAGPYYRISLSQFMADAKYESRNMEHLTEVLNHMMGTVVNWGDSAKNLKGPKYQWQGAPLITFARIRKDAGRGAVLEYEFQRELLPQLLNPSVYATISLELIAKMNTHAATVLLEIGVRYLTSPTGLTQRLPWRQWVPILTGNSSSKDDLQFKYFARDVLKPAIAQVNDAQDEFEVVQLVGKVSRRVETLQFHIRRRTAVLMADAPSRLAEVGVENLDLVGRLRILKIPQSTAESLILQFGARRMKAALAELEPRMELGKVKAPVAYLKTLLSKGDLAEAEDHVHDVEAVEVPNKPVKDNTRAALNRAYVEDAKRRAMSIFEELPLEEQAQQVGLFETQRLPEMSELLQRAWRKFRPDWPDKPITAFLRPIFSEWLAKDDLVPTEDQLLDWAANSGKLNLEP